MSDPWLIVDSPYIAHRNFHALSHLPAADIGTEVTYGFLQDIMRFQARHDSNRIVFCFDRGESYRCDIYPEYKSTRAKKYELESCQDQKRRQRLHEQMRALRKTHLPEIGFRNVFSQAYMEADDIIASVCLNSLGDDEAIVISADHDFYQLLSDQVSVWHPQQQKMITESGFRKEYGLEPAQWVNVKAIAGCKTDDIKGIDGIGEKTAAKFVRGALDHESKAWEKITNNLKVWKRNMKIVRIPFEGVETFQLRKNRVTRESWRAFAKSMGMRSLLSIDPYGT